TQLPVQGGFRTVTEQYKSTTANNLPAPVLAPLTVLPLDMPAFLDVQGSKATEPQKFSYEASGGPAQAKDPGDVNFASEVEQQVQPATADDTRGLVAEDFSKGLEKKPVVKVQLRSGPRTVTQLWQAEQPWPLYCTNGKTEARLIKVIPPEPK